MRKIIAFAGLILLISTMGCIALLDSGNDTDLSPDTFSLIEVAGHSEVGDCWMVIAGKVYDVTEFTAAHPPGSVILEGCGKNATSLFDHRPMGSTTPHSGYARKLLEEYYIGELR